MLLQRWLGSGSLHHDAARHAKNVERLLAPKVLMIRIARHWEHLRADEGTSLVFTLRLRLSDLLGSHWGEHYVKRELEGVVEHARDQMPQ